MRHFLRHFLSPALLLVATPALASGGGTMNAFGPYDVNPALTTGGATGFRTLFVDPGEFATLVQPAEALGDAADDILHVQNRTSAWTELSINGVRIGIIGPLTTVVLEGVKPGSYATSQLGPTGMTTSRVFTSDRYEDIKAQAQAARLAAEEAAAAEAAAAEGEAEVAQ